MWYIKNNETIILKVYVKTGAKRTETAKIYNDRLIIKLNSLPVKGNANKVLLKFIARLFQTTLNNVHIKIGLTSKLKTIIIYKSKINPESLL